VQLDSASTRHRDSDLPATVRRVLHLDVDAFLASVEEAEHPELRGKPLIVGGAPDSRNLVMSCSYAARALGIRPGMRSAEAQRRCPHAIFRPGDSQAANAKRRDIARILLEASPKVEIASIDDFFVDLTGSGRLLGAACDVAERLKRDIWERTHMPVTVGVGTSRILARLAGKVGKPGGVAEILPGHEVAFLARLPVEHLPGVGHVAQRKLAGFAIRTVGDLALVPREVLFVTFGHLGLVLHDRARGIDPEPVEVGCRLDERGELVVAPPKSIRRDSTFEPEEGSRERVEAMLAWLVERSAARLRQHGLVAGSMEVRVAHVDTRTPKQRHANPKSHWSETRRKLPIPSASTGTLWVHAKTLLRQLPSRRALVKRVGLTMIQLRPAGGHQGMLFSDPESDRGLSTERSAGANGSRADREAKLDAALDALRARHGFGRVLRGASLLLGEDHEIGPDGYVLRTPSLNQ
jgi:DNA polymerase IV